mmetsp:Transcript_79218/g.132284  ORF Transcript_79218/g.132284 Transcript_79218/m.132284 type:complete len:83 (+) Transcript_79218:69-317(+)
MHRGCSSPEKILGDRPKFLQKVSSDFGKLLHQPMPLGMQGLNPKILFLCVTIFHQGVVICKKEHPLASPNNDEALQSCKGSV